MISFGHPGRGSSAQQNLFAQMTITPVTSTGDVHSDAISGDGKWLAYVKDDNDGHTIYVRQVATGSTAKVLQGTPSEIVGLTFSLDGNYLFYVKRDKSVGVGTLFQVPSLGGIPRTIIVDVDSPISLAPGAKHIVFVRYASRIQTSQVLIANADGSGERVLASIKDPGRFSTAGPAWSPDGQRIAIAKSPSGNFTKYWIETITVDSGNEARLDSSAWAAPGQICWTADGSAILFPARSGEGSVNNQLWKLTYPGAVATRVTNDLNFYQSASVTSDGTTLASVQKSFLSSLYVANLGSAASFSKPLQITTGVARADGMLGLAWAAPDTILYAYYSPGAIRFNSSAPDGTNQHELGIGEGSYGSKMSRCGDARHFVFLQERFGQGTSLWRADLDGSNLKELNAGPSDGTPSCSPDGNFVLFMDHSKEIAPLMRVGIDGGPAVRVSDQPIGTPAISPDGGSVAVSYYPDLTQHPKLAVLSLADGSIRTVYDAPADAQFSGDAGEMLAWSHDGRAILYPVQRDGEYSLWAQPVARLGETPHPPKQLSSFGPGALWAYSLSPDGRQIVFSRGRVVQDAVLVSHFR